MGVTDRVVFADRTKLRTAEQRRISRKIDRVVVGYNNKQNSKHFTLMHGSACSCVQHINTHMHQHAHAFFQRSTVGSNRLEHQAA